MITCRRKEIQSKDEHLRDEWRRNRGRAEETGERKKAQEKRIKEVSHTLRNFAGYAKSFGNQHFPFRRLCENFACLAKWAEKHFP